MEREIMETRATGKTFVCGDIHGAYKALLQVFERSGFDKKTDKLICLGDVVDGWSESVEVIRELAKIKNLVYVIGNHDFWTIDYLKTGYKEPLWVSQGGKATLHSFSIHVYKGLVREMLSFFDKGVHYHKEDGRLFVHGGYNWHKPIADQDPYELMWDRHMWITANMWESQKTGLTMGEYKDIFIGHTTTSFYDKTLKPMHASNVWNLDQGAGYEGKLSLMDVTTKEYFQSDMVKELYPNDEGRT